MEEGGTLTKNLAGSLRPAKSDQKTQLTLQKGRREPLGEEQKKIQERKANEEEIRSKNQSDIGPTTVRGNVTGKEKKYPKKALSNREVMTTKPSPGIQVFLRTVSSWGLDHSQSPTVRHPYLC